MAKFSPIGPLNVLVDLNKHNALGDYLLVLAHDVKEHPKEYLQEIYHAMGDEGFLILDNSTVELGHPMPWDELVKAADEICADCIVLPDVMGDKDGTIELVKGCLPDFVEAGWGDRLMKIIQGSTEKEIISCIEWMTYNVPGDLWGVPRWIANQFGSRRFAIEEINRLRPNGQPRIHLLGMSEKVRDDIQCCQFRGVMGIDSANPLVLGQRDIKLDLYRYTHLSRGKYWDDKTVTKTTLNNIAYMRELIQ